MHIKESSTLGLISRTWRTARAGIEANPMDAVTIGTQAVDTLEGVVQLLKEAHQSPDVVRAITAATVAQARIQTHMSEAGQDRPRHTPPPAVTGVLALQVTQNDLAELLEALEMGARQAVQQHPNDADYWTGHAIGKCDILITLLSSSPGGAHLVESAEKAKRRIRSYGEVTASHRTLHTQPSRAASGTGILR
ncbi:hypothetical protein ACW73L_07310 [Methylolobus aquaticus]